MEKPKDAGHEFERRVIAVAAEAVLKEMTPEKVQELVQVMIQRALADLNTSYGPLRTAINELAQEQLKQKLQEPETREQLRQAVESGVNEAMAQLPAKTRGIVIDKALTSLATALVNSRY